MSRRVSVITVTYQSAEEVGEALASAQAAARRANAELEVVAVDNASSDGSAAAVAALLPGSVVIRNTSNVGFGRANNQAFDSASGEAWLLLNPDARLEPDALDQLLVFLGGHPKAAAVAPSIAGGGAQDRSFGPGGAESAGMRPGIASAIGHFLALNRFLPRDRGGSFRGFQLTRRPGLGPRRVEWASAAVLLLRPDAIRGVGGFDPSIFMYGEDVDLGDRLCRAGWEMWLVPSARAWHRIAGSSQSGLSTQWVDSVHDLMVRRHGRLRVASFDLIVAIGLLARSVAALGKGAGVRLHRRRMRASGCRATALAKRTLLRGPSAAETTVSAHDTRD